MSNSIISAKYSLTLSEKRFLWAILSKNRPKLVGKTTYLGDRIEFGKFYELSAVEFAEMLDIAKEDAWKDLLNISEQILDRLIVIRLDSSGKKYLKTRWISAKEVNEEAKTLAIQWAPAIVQFVSELSKDFTKLNLSRSFKIKSTYTWKIFDYVSSENWHNRYPEISLTDLLHMLDVPPSRQNYGKLKERILSPALLELKNLGLFDLKLKEFRRGPTKAITHIRLEQANPEKPKQLEVN